jgi:ABC-type thiamine transport system ATPase subunit
MIDISHKEALVLKHMVEGDCRVDGDHCQEVGTPSGVGSSTWETLVARGFIIPCRCTNDCNGFKITPLGEAALRPPL